MIGLFEGLGIALFISLFIIVVNPILTVMTINEAGLIDKLATVKKVVILAIIFLSLAAIILFIIRSFLYKSLSWLLLYTVIIGLFYIYYRLKRKKKTKPINGNKE